MNAEIRSCIDCLRMRSDIGLPVAIVRFEPGNMAELEELIREVENADFFDHSWKFLFCFKSSPRLDGLQIVFRRVDR